jgi:tetraacyldisaccharide 4'-kinase
MHRDFPAAQLIVLDDAFQYRRLRCTLDIVLVDYNRPVHKDALLPLGRLRDLPGRLYDADVVIVSKCPPYMEEADKVAFAKTLKFKSFDPVTCVAEASRGRRVTLLFSSIRYEQRQPVFESTDPHYLYAQQTLLFSGIANDAPLVNYLSDKHNVVWHHSFPDHHKYTRGDISTILAAVKKHPTASVVTTEKDAQRVLDYKEMPSKLAERTFMVPISVDFITDEEKLIFKNIITGI